MNICDDSTGTEEKKQSERAKPQGEDSPGLSRPLAEKDTRVLHERVMRMYLSQGSVG
jgi:hypothetical protein